MKLITPLIIQAAFVMVIVSSVSLGAIAFNVMRNEKGHEL